jgi:uncharacterized protein YndB with AHSA1/START domain
MMSFQMTIHIEARIGRVWKAWTDSESTAKWLAPRAKVDFRPGGAFEFFWSDDPARDSTRGCVLLRIEPERLLRFEWQGRTEFLPMFLPPAGKRTVVEVSFQRQGPGTLVTLDHPETGDHRDWAAYEAWMSKSWETALAALKKYCEKTAA